MPRRRHTAAEIVLKLREVGVLTAQGRGGVSGLAAEKLILKRLPGKSAGTGSLFDGHCPFWNLGLVR
jgi:hypothetical protein